MTIGEVLKSLSSYPVPSQVLESICAVRGVNTDEYVDAETLSQESYVMARADVLLWLADAPNVSQGGQSYSFSQDQRDRMRAEANSVLRRVQYGYKGSRL